MPDIIGNIRAIQQACYDLGIRGFTGKELKPAPRCNRQVNLPTSTCWCARGDGTYAPCPPEE